MESERGVFMSENMRFESNSNNNGKYIDCNKLNCKKLVYNKRLSRKFRLYLSDKMAYKKAFEILARKKFISH